MATFRPNRRNYVLAALVSELILVLGSSQSHADYPRYAITGLGSPTKNVNGGFTSTALFINNQGQVAGTFWDYSVDPVYAPTHTFLWQNGTFTKIPDFPGPASWSVTPKALNDSGQLLLSGPIVDSRLAFHDRCGVWRNNTVTDFGNLGLDTNGYGETLCSGLNNSGQANAVSYRFDSSGIGRGQGTLLYDSGQVQQIGPFEIHSSGEAVTSAGLPRDGVISGSYDRYWGPSFLPQNQPFIIKDGVRTDLTGFDVDSHGLVSASVSSPNSSNERAGTMSHFDSTGKFTGESAIIWQNGVVTDIATGQGNLRYRGGPINDRHQVMGSTVDFSKTPTDQRVFIWDGALHIINAGTDGVNNWQTTPQAQNQSGQAIGYYVKYLTENGQRVFHGQGAWLWENGQAYFLDLASDRHDTHFWFLTDSTAFGSYDRYTDSGSFIRKYAFAFNATDGLAQMDSLIVNLDPTRWRTIDYILDSNDSGQLVGYGTNARGDSEGFILTPIAPVPEPAALAVIVLPIIHVAALRKRCLCRPC